MEKNNSLYNLISEKVKDGTWKKGDRIFSETDLAKKLGVSRNTIREALSVFIEKGAIRKRVGSGSYIEDVAYFKDQNYILISINDFYLNDKMGEPYRHVLNYVKSEIKKHGYIPLVFLYNPEREKSVVKIDVTELAGVVSFLGNDKVDDKIIKANIPVVSIMGCTPGYYPSTIMSYSQLYTIIKDLIEKYNWKDVIFFSFVRNLFTKWEQGYDIYVHCAMEAYFESRYKFVRSAFDYNMSDAGVVFRETLKGLDKAPDAIIFPDDIVYKACYNIFFEFDEIMSKTNIVTYSSGDIDLNGKYSPCTIGFDLDKLAKSCVDLLMMYIDNKPVRETVISQPPYIKNKEVLKKVK